MEMDTAPTTTGECGERVPADVRHPFKSLSLVLASLIFSAAAVEMGRLYGIVHWRIMFRAYPSLPQPPEAVFCLLAHLRHLSTVFALVALIWAIWSIRSCPAWASVMAVGISLAILLMTMVVQT
jgi:hypothetical protein